MRTWAKKLARGLAERKGLGVAVHLPDLPNHGSSPKEGQATTIESAAERVEEVVRGTKARALIGHSLGGKVALDLARRGGAEEVWALDCHPGRMEEDLHGTEATLEKLAVSALLRLGLVKPCNWRGQELRLDLPPSQLREAVPQLLLLGVRPRFR